MTDAYYPGIRLCLDTAQPGSSHWGLYMSCDLPLFIQDLSSNPLSVEEVQNAFESLLYSADFLEATIFGRDLKKEELNLSVAPLSSNRNAQLRNATHQIVSGQWKQRGNHYILEQPMNWSNEVADKEKQALISNHQSLYIKTYLVGEEWRSQVSILSSDAFRQELDLLEKHLAVFQRSEKFF